MTAGTRLVGAKLSKLQRVHTVMLRRLSLTAAASVAALAVPAAAAQAEIIEIGQSSQEATPNCPKKCWAVSRTTGYQTKVSSRKGGFTLVRQDGRIVAWSIALGNPNKKQINYFNSHLGGEAVAQLTILKPGKDWKHRVMAQGEQRRLAPYFGTTAQFPLKRSIRVRRGWLVALTVPTWAPALATTVDSDTIWRASRTNGTCEDTSTQTAQLQLGFTPQFFCEYGARLMYSATLVTSPKPAPKAPVKQPAKKPAKKS
jgi:hypothetical protein